MNVAISIHPDAAADIMAGIKTVELRHQLPTRLAAGDTIYLVGKGRMWGHCTFAGATLIPPPGIFRDKWLEAIATPAAMPVSAARFHLETSGSHGWAWHLRYPVSYGENGIPWIGRRFTHFMYISTEPHIIHPSVENYRLYLKTHPTP